MTRSFGLCAALLLAASCASPRVLRVVDGKPVLGRFISEGAYAMYARAADAEQRGDLAGAERAYIEALAYDPDSAEIWTRVGAVRCRSAKESHTVEEAFERAAEQDADYAPLYLERARCEKARGHLAEEKKAALRALALDPESAEASIVLADALERGGEPRDALRMLLALTVRNPDVVAGWAALEALAARKNHALAGYARSHLRRLAALHLSGPIGGAAGTPSSDVDAALSAGNVPEARRLAKLARIPVSELAIRAAALGRGSIAKDLAELVRNADPNDAAARIALALAADLEHDSAALAAALDDLPRSRMTPPSPLACLLFAELLDRRVHREAALAWLRDAPAPGRPAPASDSLLERTDARVRKRLASVASSYGTF